MQRALKHFVTAGCSLFLAALTALHAARGWAGDGGEGVPAGTGSAPAPVAAQGLRVYRDPQTGQIGPPPSDAAPPGLTAAERRMLNRSDQGLPPPRILPGGGVALDLRGRYRSMAVARVGPGGQSAVNCALTPAQAAAVLQGNPRAATGTAE